MSEMTDHNGPEQVITLAGIRTYAVLLEPNEQDRLFDDFLENSDRRNPAKSCRPVDYSDLKRSLSIVKVEGRRATTSSTALRDHELKYGSVWLKRCLPAWGPIVWLTPKGELIGVFLRQEIRRFE